MTFPISNVLCFLVGISVFAASLGCKDGFVPKMRRKMARKEYQSQQQKYCDETEKSFRIYSMKSCSEGILAMEDYVEYLEQSRNSRNNQIPELTLVISKCVTCECLARSYAWLGDNEKAASYRKTVSNDCSIISFSFEDISKLATNLNLENNATNVWCLPRPESR